MTLLYAGMGPPIVTSRESVVTSVDEPVAQQVEADSPPKQNDMVSAENSRDQAVAGAVIGTTVIRNRDRSPLFDPSATDNDIVNDQVSSAGNGAALEVTTGHGNKALFATQAIGPIIDDGTALGGLYATAEQRGANEIVNDTDGIKPPVNQGNDVAREVWEQQAANSARAAFDQSRSLYAGMKLG